MLFLYIRLIGVTLYIYTYTRYNQCTIIYTYLRCAFTESDLKFCYVMVFMYILTHLMCLMIIMYVYIFQIFRGSQTSIQQNGAHTHTFSSMDSHVKRKLKNLPTNTVIKS